MYIIVSFLDIGYIMYNLALKFMRDPNNYAIIARFTLKKTPRRSTFTAPLQLTSDWVAALVKASFGNGCPGCIATV